MKSSSCSNSVNHVRSVTCKSSNSSVSSILRDSSTKRPKKNCSVRFEDSPVHPEKTVQIRLDEICATRQSSSPTPKNPNFKCFIQNSTNSINGTTEPLNNYGKKPLLSSPQKQPAVKVVAVQEVSTEIDEPRFVPKVINYAFRTSNFYDRLNKFYCNSPQKPVEIKNSPEKILIKIESNPAKSPEREGTGSKKNLTIKLKASVNNVEEKGVIHLKACSGNPFNESNNRKKSGSPIREVKQNFPKKSRNFSGQNILN